MHAHIHTRHVGGIGSLICRSLTRVCSRMNNLSLADARVRSISRSRMLSYAIGVCIHPRLAACLEKEHTLAYACAHARVCINARLASRIEKDENSDGDPQTQNYAKHATAAIVTATLRRRIMLSMQQSCNRAATVTATHRRRIMFSMQQNCNRPATELQQRLYSDGDPKTQK
jgi:hypothetical protein